MISTNEQPQKPAANGQPKKAEELLRRWTAMQADLQPFKTIWQEIGEYFGPRMANITTIKETPDVNTESLRFDSSPQFAAQIAAGGLMSWLCSPSDPWFNFAPIRQLMNRDAVKAWLNECGEEMRYVLANSNFYTEAHEDMLNHVIFATSSMYFDIEDDGELRFEALPTGSYAVQENSRGQVDTLFREFEFTPRQAAEKFGEENLPPKMRLALKDEKKSGSKFRFIHAIYPRPESERPDGVRRQTAEGMPFASCYIECAEKWIVQEKGYQKFPAPTGRYLKWANHVYGYGPGFGALPDARQGDFLNMILDIAAEKIVRPPMNAPAELEGRLSLVAGDVNYIQSGIAADRWPTPIQAAGDYNVGQDRVKMRRDVVNSWFHVELFNMFAMLDQDRRQMTAFEVNQRISQKVELIEPAYSRITTEKQRPLLTRLFSLMLDRGMLPPPPPEAVVAVSEFMGVVPEPQVQFSSRMALAIAQRHNLAFEQTVALDVQMLQFDPGALDAYDMAVIRRDRARNNGLPTQWMRSFEAEEQIKAARAEAAQAQAQMEMLEKGASAVQKAGPMLKEMQP